MFGIVGGTGLGELASLQSIEAEVVDTRFGAAFVEQGKFAEAPVVFLPRHGHPAVLPPHKINYRANIQAFLALGVTHVIAVTAVGSIDPELEVGDFVVSDQIIDYTYGRDHTFFDKEISHIDFTYPFDQKLRQQIIDAAGLVPGIKCVPTGTYGCTNGPRLETAAEVRRLGIDGCTIVGMTAMPEAALAREAGLTYAGLSVVVNKGAGLAGPLDLAEISASLSTSMSRVATVLRGVVSAGSH